MKHIVSMALMVNLAIASVYAQQPQERSVDMTFSGTGGHSTIDLLQSNTNNAEENVAGTGTLGEFTFRNVSAIAVSPESSSTCSGVYFPRVAGGGVFRFSDGSLLKVTLTQGGDCIDFVQMVGNCTLTLQITGGTGRFKDASGVLTYTETALPAMADAADHPVLFTETGEITGTISMLVETETEPQDVRRKKGTSSSKVAPR